MLCLFTGQSSYFSGYPPWCLPGILGVIFYCANFEAVGSTELYCKAKLITLAILRQCDSCCSLEESVASNSVTVSQAPYVQPLVVYLASTLALSCWMLSCCLRLSRGEVGHSLRGHDALLLPVASFHHWHCPSIRYVKYPLHLVLFYIMYSHILSHFIMTFHQYCRC